MTRVPMHDNSIIHRKKLHSVARGRVIPKQQCQHLNESMKSEKLKWREILKRIIDVILFLGERGLAFRGSTQNRSS